MMQRSILRVFFGVCIGAFAGISLTTGILPFVIAKFFEITSFEVMIEVRNFTLAVSLLWAIGGGIVGWYGGAQLGGIIIGLCGIISGFILGAFALDGNLLQITIGILSGLIYGVFGGLIVGQVFPKPI